MASSIPLHSDAGRAGFGALALAALFLAAWPLRAAAAADPSEERARAEFKKGKTAYDLGRFEDALKAYSAAYELKPLPGFLFNMGQCHKQMGNWERAVFFYKRYVSLAPSAKDAQTVRKLIEDCEAKQAEQKRKDEEAERLRKEEAEKARLAALAAASRPTEPPVGGLERPPPPGTEPVGTDKAPAYTTWWFWTAVGVAVAVAGGATAAGVVAGQPRAATPSLGNVNAR
jgi:tetratricopeptide (TPR) repeat protein